MQKDVRVKIKRRIRETGQLSYNPLHFAELFFPCMSHKTRHICKYSAGGRILSLLQNVRIGSWTHQPLFNLLTPNDDYSGRTAPLTSKRFILYIYSTNIGTDYFKHSVYSQFFPLQNAVCFIILTYFVPVLFIFYIQVC